MLSSPSSDSSRAGYAKQSLGGAAGTAGDSGSLAGISPSNSYGSNGHNQPGAGSSGSGYPASGSAYAGSGLSSGFGSGINSFGASVAFSDYPTGSGHQQATYAATQQTLQPPASSSNSHQYSQPAEQHGSSVDVNLPASGYANQKLRQAKKTIIPIVVQVEHAILENNGQAALANYNQQRANKYSGARGHRQLGGGAKRGRGSNKSPYKQGQQVPYGSASNELGMGESAQYINAANAHDINQITAAINAENAANAAAALAQADMAFGQGSPAYMGNQHGQQAGRYQQQQHQSQSSPLSRPMQQYASGLQTAASALLANSHPVLQAAASGGLASVSKLGAKLGEMMALPSMQVPNAISSIGASLPSAFSSITNQVGVQLNQAVQQVAKEHPAAHAYVRQVAQQAGIQLPNLGQQQQQQQAQHNMAAAASNQHQQQQPAPLSAQSQLQNLKLSIGQNLQTAAASLMGVGQKANAQSAAQMLASPLAVLYPASVNAALKQLTATGNGQPAQNSAAFNGQQDPDHAQSSSLVPTSVQQPAFGNPNNNGESMVFNPHGQHSMQQAQQQQAGPDSISQAFLGASGEMKQSVAGKSPSSLKSKFLSFFQPPKFISNLLSWNDRADERNDAVALLDAGDQSKPEARAANLTSPAAQSTTISQPIVELSNSTTTSTTSKAPEQVKTTFTTSVTPASTNSTSASS